MIGVRSVAIALCFFVAFVGVVQAAISITLNEVFLQIEGQYRLPAGMLGKVANIESNGNAVICAPAPSTACGMFQWTEGSWLNATKALYGTSVSLNKRFDPVTSAKVTAFALKEINDRNGVLFTRAQIDPMLGIYMGHFLGQSGSAKFLANYIQTPHALASTAFTKETLYNPKVFTGRTYAQILNLYADKLKVARVAVLATGNFTDRMGVSLAYSDADMGMNNYYPPSFVPPAVDPYRTYQTNYMTSATPAIAAGLAQWISTLGSQNGSGQPSNSSGTNTTGTGQSSSTGTAQVGTSSASSTPMTQGIFPSASIIIAQDTAISRGGSTLVSWSSVGMRAGSCTVTQNGQAFASGNEGSRVLGAPITFIAGTVSLALLCTAESGATVSKDVVVTVQ